MKKTTLSVITILCLLAGYSANAQHASADVFPAAVNEDRIAVLRASLSLPESHETLFWPLYEQYEQKHRRSDECSLTSLTELTHHASERDPVECVESIFSAMEDDVLLKKEFFEKINRSINGAVALEFLQSEALLDLILKSRMYEQLTWERPQWTPAFQKDEKARMTVMEFALGLSGEDAEKFRLLYEDFDFDYSRVVGHQLVWFEQYIEDVSFLTPAVAQQLGKEFISMQQNEIIVREKYFRKMADTFGSGTAARFIALDDYFTMMAKLKVWSDYSSQPQDK